LDGELEVVTTSNQFYNRKLWILSYVLFGDMILAIQEFNIEGAIAMGLIYIPAFTKGRTS